jgi:hypothetical protein
MFAFLVDWLLFILPSSLVGINALLWGTHYAAAKKSLADLVVTWITLCLAQIVLVQTILGALGLLSSQGILLATIVVSLVSFLLLRTLGGPVRLNWSWRRDATFIAGFLRNRTLILIVLLLAAWIGLALAFAALASASTFWDALAYHLPMSVNWLQAGRLEPSYVPSTDIANSYFPGNGELLYLWSLAPLHNDLLVRITCLGMWLVLGIVLFCLCRKLTASSEASLAATILFLFAPIVLAQTTELALDMISTMLFLLAVVHLYDFWQARSWGALCMFSLASGMFLGVKYSAPAYLLLLLAGLLIFLWWARPNISGWGRIYYTLTYAAGIALLGGYWYVRNLILTGNPLYPVEVRLLGQVILPGAFNGSYYFNRLIDHLTEIAPLDVLNAIVAGAGFLPVFAILVSIFLILRHIIGIVYEHTHNEQNRRPKQVMTSAVLLLLIGGSLLVYLNTPYSIMILTPNEPITAHNLVVGMRLGMVSFALLAVVIALGFSFSPRLLTPLWLSVAPFLAYTLLASDHEPVLWRDLMSERHLFLAGAIVTLGMFACFARQTYDFLYGKFRKASRYLTSFLILILVLAVGGGLYKTEQFRERFRYDVYQEVYGNIAVGWQWTAQNVHHARIAFAGSPLSYPLYGTELENQVRYINVAGSLDDRYHDYNHGNARAGANYQAWQSNLWQWGADYLVVSDCLEDTWASAHPEVFKPAFENSDIHIYKIEP